MDYIYQTTKIAASRRYPTYQLHARTINESLPPMTVMGICILETMSWLRGRLSQHDDIPAQLHMPEPDDYGKLDMQSLKSFHLNLGFSLDVVYSEKDRLWAFCLTEDDMGANIGTPDERKPVPGRNFETNIAFRVVENYVEAGFQTICSEPSNTTQSCEVFRPSVVKALFNNKNVGLRQVLNITDKPLEITTAKEFQRVRDAVSNPLRELPVVIITQPKAVSKVPNVPEIDLSFLSDFVSKSSLQNAEANRSSRLEIDYEALGVELNVPIRQTKKDEVPEAEIAPETEQETIIPDTVDADRIAKSAAAFAFVCRASNEMFENIRTAFQTELAKGDILIIYKDEANEVFRFSDFSDKLSQTGKAIRKGLTTYPMRRNIEWGSVVFTSDARIMDYQNRLSEKLTIGDENALLKAETEELRRKLKNAEDQNRDTNATAEEIRRRSKEITALKNELENKKSECAALIEKIRLLESNGDKVKPIIDFYKEKSRAAARFPRDKETVPDWADAEYSDTLMIHKNAVNSLKKYPRTVNMDILCDGLYFLHGYGLYRQGKITEETLEMFAEEYGWEVQGCGKESIKMFHNDYSIPMGKSSKELNMHIKYGVSPQHWIRIYFYYDEELRRVVIGFMPDHLRTVSDKT